MNKVVKGNIILVDNKERKGNSKRKYYFMHVQLVDGEETAIMFTAKELDRMWNRAQKNKEDWKKKGWFQDLID